MKSKHKIKFQNLSTTSSVQDQVGYDSNIFFYHLRLENDDLTSVYFDDNIEKILGYKLDEIMGYKFREVKIFDCRHKDYIMSIFQEAGKKSQQFKYETIMLHKEGYPIFVRNRGVSVVNGPNDINYKGIVEFVASLQIDTYQPETFSKIIKIAYDLGIVGAFYFDIINSSIHWSEEIKKMHGYDIEPTIEEFSERVESNVAFNLPKLIEKVLNSKDGFQTIYRYTRKSDNRKRYFLAMMYPIIDDKKKLIAISGNAIDLFDEEEDLKLPETNTTEEERDYTQKDSVYIKQGHSYIKIQIKDIIAVSSMRDYVQVYTTNRIPPYIQYNTMLKFKKLLPKNLFVQIHRSHIVNKEFIQKVSSNQVIANDLVFPMSRGCKSEVMKFIKSTT